MHQMRISTNYVSSKVFRPKKLEIWKFCYNCNRAGEKKPKTECHETEPNSSKDRAMYEGDNPSSFSGLVVLEKIFKWPHPIFVIISLLQAICPFTQGWFVPSLIEICLLVLEKNILLIDWLFIYCFATRSRIFHLYELLSCHSPLYLIFLLITTYEFLTQTPLNCKMSKLVIYSLQMT
jgi:hypothetical protein